MRKGGLIVLALILFTLAGCAQGLKLSDAKKIKLGNSMVQVEEVLEIPDQGNKKKSVTGEENWVYPSKIDYLFVSKNREIVVVFKNGKVKDVYETTQLYDNLFGFPLTPKERESLLQPSH